MLTTRWIYFLGFILVSSILCFSIYLQVIDGFNPCPLCTMQRLGFGLIGIWCLIGLSVVRFKSARLAINILCFLTAILGIFFAGRQIWLQYLPPGAHGECGVGLQYMLATLPWQEVLQKVFAGSADCAERSWEFLHLSMAEWSLIWFIFLLFSSMYLIWRSIKYN